MNDEINTESSVNLISFENDPGTWDNDTSTCSSMNCHGDVDWNTIQTIDDFGCDFCHAPGYQYDPRALNGSGSSGKHIPHVTDKAYTCETCHNNYKDSTTHANGELDTNNTTNILSFQTDPGSWNNDTSTCGSMDCHGDVSWYTDETLGCTLCHASGLTYDPFTNGKHTEHINSNHASIDINCETCHDGYKEHADHFNGTLESVNIVSFNPYSGTWNNGSNSCDDMDCHGNNDGDANWLTGGLSCDDCHDNAYSAYYPTLGNRHSTHINNYSCDCATCHNTYGDGGTHLNGTNDTDLEVINLVPFDNPSAYDLTWDDSANRCSRSGDGCHSAGNNRQWND